MVQLLPLFVTVSVALALVWGAVEFRMALRGPSATMLNMRSRAGTWAWLLAGSAPALWWFPVGPAVLCLLLGCVASLEILQVTRASARASLVGGLVAVVCVGCFLLTGSFLLTAGVVLGALSLCHLWMRVSTNALGPAPALLALASLGTLGLAAAFLRDTGPSAAMALLALFCTQLSDALQYVVGKLFGRRPLAPTLSPNKTWEGALGGIGLAVAASVAVAPWLALSPAASAGAAALFCAGGLAGGLALSACKRHLAVKDWGSLLPGHGGVLDRIDSVLLAGVALGVYAG